MLQKGFTDIGIRLAMRPGTVVRKFQLNLFPERDAKLFYKIVFGRWLLGLILAFLIGNIYSLSVRWIDNQKEIDLKQIETSKITSAWHRLYLIKNKNIHASMDSILNSTGNENLKRK